MPHPRLSQRRRRRPLRWASPPDGRACRCRCTSGIAAKPQPGGVGGRPPTVNTSREDGRRPSNRESGRLARLGRGNCRTRRRSARAAGETSRARPGGRSGNSPPGVLPRGAGPAKSIVSKAVTNAS
jgi:hypothetical protein